MSNLKTLRNFDFDIVGLDCFQEKKERDKIVKELRDEAIKHIKKLERRILELTGTNKSDWILQNKAVIGWIEEFFNISEGDLSKCQ